MAEIRDGQQVPKFISARLYNLQVIRERSTRIYQTQVQAHIIIIFEAEEGARSISSEYADMA